MSNPADPGDKTPWKWVVGGGATVGLGLLATGFVLGRRSLSSAVSSATATTQIPAAPPAPASAAAPATPPPAPVAPAKVSDAVAKLIKKEMAKG